MFKRYYYNFSWAGKRIITWAAIRNKSGVFPAQIFILRKGCFYLIEIDGVVSPHQSVVGSWSSPLLVVVVSLLLLIFVLFISLFFSISQPLSVLYSQDVMFPRMFHFGNILQYQYEIVTEIFIDDNDVDQCCRNVEKNLQSYIMEYYYGILGPFPVIVLFQNPSWCSLFFFWL